MGTTLEVTRQYFDDLKDGCNNLIDCQALYKNIGAGENMFILDIRKEDDFTGNSIEGSIHYEWENVFDLIEDEVLPKDKKIVVVCYTGQSAGQITAILRLLGYDACSLLGGMDNGWMKNSMPIEAGCSTWG